MGTCDLHVPRNMVKWLSGYRPSCALQNLELEGARVEFIARDADPWRLRWNGRLTNAVDT